MTIRWPCLIALFAFPAAANAQRVTGDWSGFYAGLHAGVGISDPSNTPPTVSSDSPFIVGRFGPTFGAVAPVPLDADEGFIGGGQIGYNFRVSNILLGIEGDLSGATVGSSHAETTIGFTDPATGLDSLFTTKLEHEVDWLATIRGRIGFLATEWLLLYGTAGVAFGGVDTSLTYSNDSTFLAFAGDGISSEVICEPNSACFSGRDDDVRTGWAFGGGFEYALSSTVSLKGEYLFVDLGSQNIRAVGTSRFTTADNSINTRVDTELHIGRVGLNIQLD